MNNIKFDDGYETFTLNGDPNRVIRFNARDTNILLRYEKGMDEMKVECGRLSDGGKEDASTLEELNQFIFDRIDYIFNSDVAGVAFGNQSPLTLLPNGRFLFEVFMESVLNEVAKRRGKRWIKEPRSIPENIEMLRRMDINIRME